MYIGSVLSNDEKRGLSIELALLYLKLNGDKPASPAEFTAEFLKVEKEIRQSLPAKWN